jgi:hypothetical protein
MDIVEERKEKIEDEKPSKSLFLQPEVVADSEGCLDKLISRYG